MSVLVLSDLHGNLSAFQAVLDRAAKDHDITSCILLGDLIDYGMCSNEVIKMVENLPYKILCSIRGNHEDAVIRDEYSRFSSDRGRDSARYTRSILTPDSWDYLNRKMAPDGKAEFAVNGKKCLAIHGSLKDPYWKSIRPEEALEEYIAYDYVFSDIPTCPTCLSGTTGARMESGGTKRKWYLLIPVLWDSREI